MKRHFRKFFPLAVLMLSSIFGSSAHAAEAAATATPDPYPKAGFYNNAVGSPVFKMINAANETLDIEIYLMNDLDVRAAIRTAINDRHVKVRVVREPKPLGDSCRIFDPSTETEKPDCADQKKLKDEIIAAGGTYVPFNKANLCANPHKPCYMHGKMVIADKKAMLISTGNFNSSNLCNLAQHPDKCNRDYTVVARDATTIAFFAGVFESDVNQLPYDLPSHFDARMTARATVSPLSLDPLVKLIQSATETIDIQNQYLKEPTLNAAIIERASQGVKVYITVASSCSFARPTAHEKIVVTDLMTAFEAAGVSVRMMPSQYKISGKPAYLHSKAIVVDGKRAWVGSVNGSAAGTSNNREFGLFLTTQRDTAALLRILVNDHNSPDMETWQDGLNCKKDRRAISNDGDAEG